MEEVAVATICKERMRDEEGGTRNEERGDDE
jgi:hypothetical protein